MLLMVPSLTRIAIICQNRSIAQNMARHLSSHMAFDLVHTGQNLSRGFRKLVKRKPHVILVDTTAPNCYRDFDPKFQEVKNALPGIRIVIRTELDEEHHFVREAYNNGASIIDDRLEYLKIAQTLQDVLTVEKPVIRYRPEVRHITLGNFFPSRCETASLNPIELKRHRPNKEGF